MKVKSSTSSFAPDLGLRFQLPNQMKGLTYFVPGQNLSFGAPEVAMPCNYFSFTHKHYLHF
jgi:hypothetical protein